MKETLEALYILRAREHSKEYIKLPAFDQCEDCGESIGDSKGAPSQFHGALVGGVWCCMECFKKECDEETATVKRRYTSQENK